MRSPLYSVYRYWDILTEKIWKIFIRKWVLANQRSERYFSHVKKKIETSNHNRERSFFQLWEKWYVQSKATEVCEFRAKIPAFYRLLKFAAPSLCELLRRYSTRKDNKVEFFFVEKWKTSRKLDWNSFVYFTIVKENWREPANQQRKGKNRTWR